LGFAIVGLDVCTIGSVTHPSIGSGLTNNAELLQLILYICFSISSGSGQTVGQFPTIAKPCPLSAMQFENIERLKIFY
jgi:hypothetical protein